MLEETPIEVEESTASTRGRKPSVPATLIDDRREYTVSLKLSGLSLGTIQKQVNKEAATRGWGEVSRRTIERDIAEFFRKNSALSIQDYDHLEQMRSAHLAEIEIGIEKMALHISTKRADDWKPFEKADAIAKLHQMKMDYAELQNWNIGRRNPLVAIQQNNINQVFDAAASDLSRTKPEAIQALVNQIDLAIDKMNSKKEEGYLPDVVEPIS